MLQKAGVQVFFFPYSRIRRYFDGEEKKSHRAETLKHGQGYLVPPWICDVREATSIF